MTQCPKCGNGIITGPQFERDQMQREHLRYTCGRCGYSMTTPTLDQKVAAKQPLQGTVK